VLYWAIKNNGINSKGHLWLYPLKVIATLSIYVAA
jgi:hypothetical protein